MATGINCCALFLAAVFAFSVNLPTRTAALPMKGLIGQAMMSAKLEMEQKEEVLEQQHRLEKRAVQAPCTVPTNLTDMFMKLNANLSATQFLQAAVNGQVVASSATDKARFLGGDPNESKTCPASVTRDRDAPLSHRSLCPYWFDILELPQGYYPRTVKLARCKCQTCLENNVYVCEPLETNIVVLKPAGCFQGTQKYEEQILSVPTSCTCAFKGVVQDNFQLAFETTTLSWGVQ